MKTVFDGPLKLTSRYFDQNRGKAMRGQIERALVELITNSDDSYRELEDRNLPTHGTIRIEVQRKRKNANSVVVVKDRAAGMTATEMCTKIAEPGSRTSGFERGLNRRGLHGRGAKDVTEFGIVIFESIKEDMYAKCVLSPDTHCKIEESRATTEIRDRLGLKRGNGTVVTVEVAPRFDIPQHHKIVERFSSYFSLRDIFSNPKRRVILVDLNKHPPKEDPLQYRYPEGEIKINEKFPIAGYEGAFAHLLIKRHKQKFQEDKHGYNAPYRAGGILIKSAAAIHEITLFRYENDPYAEWYSGELECAHIDQLVREYDDERDRNPNNPAHTQKNPIRLLDPERDGLIREHPFAKVLFLEAEARLQKLIEQERAIAKEDEKEISSEKTRKKLSDLARKAAHFMEEKFRELQEELPGGGPGFNYDKYPEGLTIIPANEYSLKLDERKTFSVIVKAAHDLPESPLVTVVSDSPGVQVLNQSVPLTVEKKNGGLGRCTFALEGKELGSQAFVSASTNGYQNVLLVEVVEPEPNPVDPPKGLSFESGEYEVVLKKEKHAVLWLNFDGITSDKCQAQVSSSSDDVVVRPQLVSLRLVRDSVFSGAVTFEGRRLHATANIRAKWQELEATCAVSVVQDGKSKADLKFDPVDRDFGVVRAVWNKDYPNVLEIAGRHPVIRRYLGSKEQNFPGEKTKEYLMVLAEVISEAICQRILETKDRKQPIEEMRATDFYTEHFRLMREFLPVAHEELVDQQ